MTVTVSWTLPTQRTDNKALPVSEIAFVRFSVSQGGGALTHLIDVKADVDTTSLDQNFAPGSYVLRAVVHDRQTPARLSTPVDTPFVIPVTSLAAPNPVTGLTAAVTP